MFGVDQSNINRSLEASNRILSEMLSTVRRMTHPDRPILYVNKGYQGISKYYPGTAIWQLVRRRPNSDRQPGADRRGAGSQQGATAHG